MTEANLNPTIDGYRGSIGKLVFKRYRGRTIVAKKPVVTAEPSPAQLMQRQQFKAAAAFGKFAQQDPALHAFYEPIALERGVSIYTVAVGDFLNKPQIKPLDLDHYKGQVGDPISIRATDDLGLADLDVEITSNQGALIEAGKAVETFTGSGIWTYTATVPVALGADIFIEVVGVDHAGNRVKLTESPRVGQDE